MLKMINYVTTPVGVYIDEKNTIHVISLERKSLYEILHTDSLENIKLTSFHKLTILIQLAKILNTFHCLRHKTWAHGNLTPHNIFVDLPKNIDDIETELRVQVDGIELTDLKKYANMFYSYRSVSVWSAPEVLKTPKKILEPLTPMDVYSFGLIMWELFHE